MGTDLEHAAQEHEAYQRLQRQGDMVRTQATLALKEMLDALAPYIDGSIGPVSPRHVAEARGLWRQITDLYGVTRLPPPPPPPPEPEPEAEPEETAQARQVRVEQLRGAALKALEVLRNRHE